MTTGNGVKLNNTIATTTADKAIMDFYDVESLYNAFTVAFYKPSARDITIFYWIDIDGYPAGYTLNAEEHARACEYILRTNPTVVEGTTVNLYNIAIVDPQTTPYAEANNMALAQRLLASSEKNLYNPGRTTDKQNQTTRSHNIFGAPVLTDIMAKYDPSVCSYLAGYNSRDYDTTILSYYLGRAFDYRHWNSDTVDVSIIGAPRNDSTIYDINKKASSPLSPRDIRSINDAMFDLAHNNNKSMASILYGYANTEQAQRLGLNTLMPHIRLNFFKSGRHIDIAKLNEKQFRVGLKRLSGMLGHKILESDKLDSNNAMLHSINDLIELFAYNVSDVVNLNHLFHHDLYSGSFTLRSQLLNTYPETVFAENAFANEHADVLKNYRMTIDSSSAQFVANILAPYSKMDDIPTVNFMYPAPDRVVEINKNRAPEDNIEAFDVLEKAKEFFYNLYDDSTNDKHLKARAEFDKIYDFYDSIRGKNFNENNDNGQVANLRSLANRDTNIFYYDKDANPTSGFITFSTGGIHGAEYDLKAYAQAYNKNAFHEAALLQAKLCADGDPLAMRHAKSYDTTVTWIDIHGVEHQDQTVIKYTDVLTPKSTMTQAEWRTQFKGAKNVDIFKQTAGSQTTKLNPTFIYTSHSTCSHEDFTSYYPRLLNNMAAFYNPSLGEDRYDIIFNQKEEYGKLRKDPSLSQHERDMYNILREGTKLILNSASGAGDANHNTNIRMNNRIISMRIIGQLFSWMIGQDQSYHGATIVSTNTDGLYSELDFETNSEILKKWESEIAVDIEPEEMILISKDSNNRVEFSSEINPDTGTLDILSASGASLSCWRGPNPGQSLSHPAMMDRILVEYLRHIAAETINPATNKPLSLSDPFNKDIARDIIAHLHQTLDTPQLLLLYQNIITSSNNPYSLPYTISARYDNKGSIIPATDNETYKTVSDEMPDILQHYNRVFMVKKPEDFDPLVKVMARAVERAITPAMAKKRQADANSDNPRNTNVTHPWAAHIFIHNGLDDTEQNIIRNSGKNGKDITLSKITNLNDTTPVIIANHSIHHNNDVEAPFSNTELLERIDPELYIELAEKNFNTNWKNV